jgi:hypothetical protein
VTDLVMGERAGFIQGAAELAEKRTVAGVTGVITWLFARSGGVGMIAWILSFFVGLMLLPGFAFYLCRAPRRRRRITSRQIEELQVLADLERHENLL